MAGFAVSQLARIDGALEVEIETWAATGAPRHRVIVWIVTADGEVYVRSVQGSRGRWYRELNATNQAVLHVADERIAVRAESAVSADRVERCSRALERKYATDPALSSMLQADVLSTTMRLMPT
ncbi:MAG TPA: DUF2255 family protein [Candidatus Saccharimonadia bacterium]|nr:DUF2255 family protein [Candidatus Saccharimonadia bacterium]